MARSFDGTDDRLDQTTTLTLDDFTVAFWMLTSSGTFSSVFGVFDDGATEGLMVQINSNKAEEETADTMRFYVRDGDAGDDGAEFTVAAFDDGSWHHHALTRTGVTTAYYFDGASQSLTYQTGQDELGTGTLTIDRVLSLGARNVRGVFGQYSDISLAEFAIYSDNLTVVDIGSLSDGFSPKMVRPNVLLRYWPMSGRTSPEIELITGDLATLTGDDTFIDHPRIIYPAPRHIITAPVAAAPTAFHPTLALTGVGF